MYSSVCSSGCKVSCSKSSASSESWCGPRRDLCDPFCDNGAFPLLERLKIKVLDKHHKVYAYSDTFGNTQMCHCKLAALYNNQVSHICTSFLTLARRPGDLSRLSDLLGDLDLLELPLLLGDLVELRRRSVFVAELELDDLVPPLDFIALGR